MCVYIVVFVVCPHLDGPAADNSNLSAADNSTLVLLLDVHILVIGHYLTAVLVTTKTTATNLNH